MPYGLVPSALRETGKTFRSMLSHEATARVSKAQMGLARTKLGYDLQKDQREIFMNTPNTVENIVNGLPVSDEQKQQLINTPQYKLLQEEGGLYTPAQISNAMNRIREEKQEAKRLLDTQVREDELLEEAHGRKEDLAIAKDVFDTRRMREEAELERGTKESVARIKAEKAFKKEQRTSEARLKAADTKYIRSLEKELRTQEAELRKQELEGRNVLIEGKAEPIYEATKHSVQVLKDKIAELKGTKKAGAEDLTATMPPAEQNKGRFLRDTETNILYKSIDGQWIEQ